MAESPSDDDLFRRIQAGDEAAFTAFFRRWQGPLYRFALRMTGSGQAAEDVTQEVFMAVIHGNAYDPDRGPVAAYLYGIARNQVLRRLDRDRPLVPVDDAEAAAGNGSMIGRADDPHRALVRREEVEAVRQAVLSLPPHYREAVVLCDLQHLAYDDAARVLGCAVGTVRSRLHRARELLVGKLRAHGTPAVSARFEVKP